MAPNSSTPDRRVKALLLAAGVGSRLRPLTLTTPKCLVEIEGRPLLGYWLDALDDCDVSEVLVNTHHLREPVQTYLETARKEHSFVITESHEPELLGSAGTISANADFMDDADTCVIIYADNLSNVDLASLLSFHETHEDPFSMLLFHTSRPKECGIATLDDESRVIEFVEKPANPTGDLANAGVYVIDADAYREIAAMNAFDLGFDVLPRFAGRMRGQGFDGYHLDIGNLDALEQARLDAPKHFGGTR